MHLFTLWLLLLGVPLLHPPSSSGLKFAVRHTHDGISSEQTLYVEQDRRRTEYRNSMGAGPQGFGPRLLS